MRVRGRRRGRKRAFTLIELLVVISILIFLAGMLLIVIHRTHQRLKANATKQALSRIDLAISALYQGCDRRLWWPRYAPNGETLLANLYKYQHLERKDETLDGWSEEIIIKCDPGGQKIFLSSRGYDRKLGVDPGGTDDDNLMRVMDIEADAKTWEDGLPVPNPTERPPPTAPI